MKTIRVYYPRMCGVTGTSIEHRYLCEVVAKHATRTAWLPWQPEEPTGPEALAHLAASNLQPMLS